MSAINQVLSIPEIKAEHPRLHSEAVYELEEKENRLRWWLETYDMTMPCGHKSRYAVNAKDGTQFCIYCCAVAYEAENEILRGEQ